MIGLFLIGAAIPLAAYIRRRLEPRRYVRRAAMQLPAPAEMVKVRR